MRKITSLIITIAVLISIIAPITTSATEVGVSIDGAHVGFTNDSGEPFVDSSFPIKHALITLTLWVLLKYTKSSKH